MKTKNWITCTDIKSVPDLTSGVYAIYFDGKLAYIGSAVNVRRRLAIHSQTAGWLNHVLGENPQRAHIKYRKTQKFGDWAMIELRLIRRLKPRLNKQHAGGAR